MLQVFNTCYLAFFAIAMVIGLNKETDELSSFTIFMVLSTVVLAGINLAYLLISFFDIK